MVTNNLVSIRQVKIFVAAFLITCFIICLYVIPQIGVVPRVSAPFEGEEGEANTLGGYLMLIFSVCAGFVLCNTPKIWRISSGIIMCLIIPCLLFTLSRGSYISFISMYIALIIFSPRKKLTLIFIALLFAASAPFVMPKQVKERIKYTFTPYYSYRTPLGNKISLEPSAATRIENWKIIFDAWKKSPLLGYGVTGVGLVDTQLPRVLGETGIVGFLIFLWLLTAIFKSAFYTFRSVEDEWLKGLTLGFLAGFFGIIMHSFSANTFIIIRIMEPFWFLAAIIIAFPLIEKENKPAAAV